VKGAKQAIRHLNELGYRVVVVTNQAGVAHGYYDEAAVTTLHLWMQDQFGEAGAFVDHFYYCPFHPEARIEQYRRHHENRKPSPGMILQAFADYSCTKEGSFLIGDQPSDIKAAEAAGIPGFLSRGKSLGLCQRLPRGTRDSNQIGRDAVVALLTTGPTFRSASRHSATCQSRPARSSMSGFAVR